MLDISVLGSNSIKIRTKRVSFVVDPVESISQTNADAVIVLGKETVDLARVSNYRVILQGEGEYEIEGVKISGIAAGEGFVYSIFADNMEIVLGRVSRLLGIQNKSLLSQIALLNVDGELKSLIANLEPRAVILYGEKRLEGAKELGKDPNPISKVTVTREKLDKETEVVVLG